MAAIKHEMLWPELIWVVAEHVYFPGSCMGNVYSTMGWICSIFEDLCVPGTLSALEIVLGGGSGKLEMEDGYI